MPEESIAALEQRRVHLCQQLASDAGHARRRSTKRMRRRFPAACPDPRPRRAPLPTVAPRRPTAHGEQPPGAGRRPV